MNGWQGCQTEFWKGTTRGPSQPNLVLWFQRRFKCDFFIKICPICINHTHQLKETFHRKTNKIYWTTLCYVAAFRIWAHSDNKEATDKGSGSLKGNHPSQNFFNLVQQFQKFKCDLLSNYTIISINQLK